jgi:hypothetical protein
VTELPVIKFATLDEADTCIFCHALTVMYVDGANGQRQHVHSKCLPRSSRAPTHRGNWRTPQPPDTNTLARLAHDLDLA